MPTQFSPQLQQGLAEAITQQLEREFTRHSRPDVEIQRSALEDAILIRVRIFDSVRYQHSIPYRDLVDGRIEPGRLIDNIVHRMIAGIRGSEPRSPIEQANALMQMQNMMSAREQYQNQLMGTWADTWSNQIVDPSQYTFRLGAYAAANVHEDSGPAAAFKGASVDGLATGVAPSRGDIGATMTALDLVLSDELDEVA